MGCCSSKGAVVPALQISIGCPPVPNERLIISVEAETDIGGIDKKENQDVFLMHPAFVDEPSRHMFGVMDGHGVEGSRVAQYCGQAMRRSFEETHARVSNRSKSHCDASASGTTATIALLEHKELLIGWVGDSQVCIIQEAKPGQLTLCWMSRVHQFSEVDEKQRALQCGGRVGRNGSGPLRVYFEGANYPGLMVSRSLGDSDAHTIGVSAEPEFYHRTLCPEDRYIVLCSDGVWDVLTASQVVEILQTNDDLRLATRRIVSKAKSEWARHKGRSDNITAVIAMVHFP